MSSSSAAFPKLRGVAMRPREASSRRLRVKTSRAQFVPTHGDSSHLDSQPEWREGGSGIGQRYAESASWRSKSSHGALG